MSDPRRHSRLVGVIASVLLHGAALLVFRPHGPHLPPPPRADPLIVEFLAPAEPVASDPPRPSRPAPRAPATSPRSRPVASASAPPGSAPRPSGAPAPSSRAWFEEHGLGPTPPEGGTALDLRLPASPPGSGQGASDASADVQPGPGTEGRVASILAEAAGQARVRDSVDPSWSPLAERLRAAFVPDWSLLDVGPGQGTVAGSGLARTFQGYLRMAERYARSERLSDQDGLMGERTSEAGRVADRVAAAGSQSSTGIGPPVERGENPFQRRYVTLVEVAHGDDGSVAGIRLRRSCGLGAVDRLAVASTRRALAEGGPRAAPGLARRSVWAFTATFGVVPPAPVIACPPDVLWRGGFDRCAYPLKRLAEGRVELHALE